MSLAFSSSSARRALALVAALAGATVSEPGLEISELTWRAA